jgi:hypothetical protein
MHPVAILQLLVLLSVANGAPVLAKKLFGSTLAQPIDGGVRFIDRRPLLGGSKTIRGVVISVTLTAAPLLGLELSTGAVVGAAAMAGDLLSSFAKRRLHLPPSSRATGLDQIPEALFPLLACRGSLSLTLADIVIGVLAFFGGEVLLSRVFYQIGLRDRPY